MFRKMPWLDRIGILGGLCIVFGVAFLWFTGWAALKALFLACSVVFVFVFLLIWAAHRRDDNPNNDSVKDILKDMGEGAKQEWKNVVEKARTSGDAEKK
jgi:uncharacterized membrane protein